MVAWVSNIVKDPDIVPVFVLFFLVSMLFVFGMYYRLSILLFFLHEFERLPAESQRKYARVKDFLLRMLRRVESSPVIAFVHRMSALALAKVTIIIFFVVVFLCQKGNVR